MLDAIKKLVQDTDVCVLATCREDQPHCSLMSYAPDAETRNLYMVTMRESRKYRNIQANPWVSLLIDTRMQDFPANRAKARALTVEGVHRPIPHGPEREKALALYLARRPEMAEFAGRKDVEVIRIRIKGFQLLEGVEKAHHFEVE